MTCNEIKKAIYKIGEYFECEEFDKFILVDTPFDYPDGDPIQIFVIKEGNNIVLTDFGETLSYLTTNRFDVFSSKKREKTFNMILKGSGVKFKKGELRIENPESITSGILKLIEACLRVSDLVFIQRVRVGAAFKEQVSDFLLENNISFKEDYFIEGSTGESYRVDFFLYVEPSSGLLQTLSSRTESYAKILITKTFTMWFDLKEKDGRYRYFSLIDDTKDVWESAMLKLLDRVSEVYFWSKKEEFLKSLVVI